ncbi:MAG: lytic transglycosylase [Pseudomonadota bacterium]|jgi:soluble lytic murein transglycosylase-like protein
MSKISTKFLSHIFKVLNIFTIILITNFSMLSNANAGAQKEEELTHAVRSALVKAIADGGYANTTNLFHTPDEQQVFEAWKTKVSSRLHKRIPNDILRHDLIDNIYYEAKRAGLEPELVLGLIQVESGFKKYAISVVSARGLMQVMPFWTRTIGNGDVSALFNPQVNLRYGCTILRHYLDREKGNLYLALGRYNGSRGQPQYPNAIRGAWDMWKRVTN